MNHKWGKTFKDEHGMKSKVCRTCGCKKINAYGVEIHMRSGIVFHYLPDCIDEEIEKTSKQCKHEFIFSRDRNGLPFLECEKCGKID